jgi:hypothetical protein
MPLDKHDRKQFLLALVEYARESNSFNPHFLARDMLGRLGIDRLTFNILIHSLGHQYCYPVGPLDGEDRFAINLAACLALSDDFERGDVESKRHRQTIVVAFISAVLGALLGVVFTLWLHG